MIYGRYDLTFLPEFSVQAAGEFLQRGLDTTIKALPCGHYSLGETPYKYMDAWHISALSGEGLRGIIFTYQGCSGTSGRRLVRRGSSGSR